MNFESIKRELGLDSNSNGFLRFDENEENINFCLDGIFRDEFIVCTLSDGACWGESDRFEDDVDFTFKFMKDENRPLEPLDPEIGLETDSEVRTRSESRAPSESEERSGKFVTYHGKMFRLQNEDCAFFFCKRFIWGKESTFGHNWFALPGEEVSLDWFGEKIVFTFENAIEWLRTNGYVYRKTPRIANPY